ncbi:HD domain-containing protein [Haloarchaeobius sp. HME9146]|uniref:HD domain-containing protein n=1 Tax=Haloarchaeobius sp. HME9146 TaxID=2978732 RepID=UPI0021BE6FD9|nr:HD domain-containing protein [Haloarchaeobius sp. HME9146]MCT9094982.1 HD domain-containing protein [Haloarchaeobius sp. HME9146]
MDQTALRDRARTYFGGLSPCHDWHHVERVVANAERLVTDTDREVDEDVLLAAAWLHDIGRKREADGEIDCHAEWGAEEARDILAEFDVDAETRAAVAHCTRAHRFSNDVEPESFEAKLLSDADNLDAIGAVGLARMFAHTGEIAQPIHDPELPPEDDDSTAGETAFNHLHKKLLELDSRMYTDVGREVAADRHDFLETFVSRFEAEVTGER